MDSCTHYSKVGITGDGQEYRHCFMKNASAQRLEQREEASLATLVEKRSYCYPNFKLKNSNSAAECAQKVG